MWLIKLFFPQFCKYEVRIYRSFSESLLEFEITGVDCILKKNGQPPLNYFHCLLTCSYEYPQWLEPSMSRANVHDPKAVRAIEDRQYVDIKLVIDVHLLISKETIKPISDTESHCRMDSFLGL